jgi:hypothetical protein
MRFLSSALIDLLRFPVHLLSDRLADDRVHSVALLLPADMRKAQEVEGPRSPLIAPLSVLNRKRTELQKPRLLRIERQAKLCESLLQLSQAALRLHLALQPDHEVVRPSDDDHVALSLRPPPVLDPQIQDVVKKHIRQKRGDNPALRRSFFDGLPLPLLHHASAQPFLDEPYDVRVTDPKPEELLTYGHQEGVAVGFVPKKCRGHPSYAPIISSECRCGLTLGMELRAGNVHPTTGALSFLNQMLDKLPSSIATTRTRLRLDGAFYDRKIIEAIDQA